MFAKLKAALIKLPYGLPPISQLLSQNSRKSETFKPIPFTSHILSCCYRNGALSAKSFSKSFMYNNKQTTFDCIATSEAYEQLCNVCSCLEWFYFEAKQPSKHKQSKISCFYPSTN